MGLRRDRCGRVPQVASPQEVQVDRKVLGHHVARAAQLVALVPVESERPPTKPAHAATMTNIVCCSK